MERRFGGKRGVRGAECGVWKTRSVENEGCGKRGVWKIRSVENAECGKCRTFQFQYEINKSNSFIFSLKECFILL